MVDGIEVVQELVAVLDEGAVVVDVIQVFGAMHSPAHTPLHDGMHKTPLLEACDENFVISILYPRKHSHTFGNMQVPLPHE